MTCGCSPFTPPPGVSVLPLSNTFFVDGGTTTPLADQNGSILRPFASLAQVFAVAVPGTTIVVTEDNYGALALDGLGVTIVAWSNAVLGPITLTGGASLVLRNISGTSVSVTESIFVAVNCAFGGAITLTDPIEASFDLLTLARTRALGAPNPFGAMTVRDAPTVREFLILPALTAPDAADITIAFDGARPGDTFTATGLEDVNPWPAAAILGQPRCETADEVIVPIMTITANVAADECALVVTQFPVARGG